MIWSSILFLWSWSEKDQNFPIVFCYGNRYFFCIFLKESLKKSSRKFKTSIHKLKNLFNIRKKILCFILEEMLNGILCLFFNSRKSWTSTSCRRNNKKIRKKSDRVIGNQDLIANPFFQGCFQFFLLFLLQDVAVQDFLELKKKDTTYHSAFPLIYSAESFF